MNLTPEKKLAKEYRNSGMIKDWLSNMNRHQIAKKYHVSHQSVYSICRHTPRNRKEEEITLTEGEQRIRDKYKSLTDIESFHKRDFTVTNFGILEPLITVQPKHRYA